MKLASEDKNDDAQICVNESMCQSIKNELIHITSIFDKQVFITQVLLIFPTVPPPPHTHFRLCPPHLSSLLSTCLRQF